MPLDTAKVQHAVKMRQARDKVIRDLLGRDDIDSVAKAGAATSAWLEVENELNPEEFTAYMEAWRGAAS